VSAVVGVECSTRMDHQHLPAQAVAVNAARKCLVPLKSRYGRHHSSSIDTDRKLSRKVDLSSLTNLLMCLSIINEHATVKVVSD
jgi:hypothetical protein